MSAKKKGRKRRRAWRKEKRAMAVLAKCLDAMTVAMELSQQATIASQSFARVGNFLKGEPVQVAFPTGERVVTQEFLGIKSTDNVNMMDDRGKLHMFQDD